MRHGSGVALRASHSFRLSFSDRTMNSSAPERLAAITDIVVLVQGAVDGFYISMLEHLVEQLLRIIGQHPFLDLFNHTGNHLLVLLFIAWEYWF